MKVLKATRLAGNPRRVNAKPLDQAQDESETDSNLRYEAPEGRFKSKPCSPRASSPYEVQPAGGHPQTEGDCPQSTQKENYRGCKTCSSPKPPAGKSIEPPSPCSNEPPETEHSSSSPE